MLVGPKWMSAALGLLAALAAAPAPGQDAGLGRNQATADRVAVALRDAANRTGSRVGIEANAGLVTLTGEAPDAAVKADLIARAGRVPGVAAVADGLRVSGDARVRTVQFQPQPQPTPTAGPLTPRQPVQVAMGGHLFHRNAGMGVDDGMMGPVVEGAAGGADMGPLPEGLAASGATQASLPRYPNYAWPSYAPYPNFSAVGYPTVYPWQAWPNIGPFYPYPEVPLDWRAVTARYHDGVWYTKFRTGYTRPFFFVWPLNLLTGY